MPKKLDLNEIIKQNPQVDPKLLSESMELLAKLQGYGVSGRRYELVTPGAGKRVQIIDSSTSDDPETTYLIDPS